MSKIKEVPSEKEHMKGFKECLIARQTARKKSVAWRNSGEHTDSEILDYLLYDEM